MEYPVPQAMPHPYWHAPIDPVCGHPIGPIPIPYHACHGDKDFYFCSFRCLERFSNDPTLYHQATHAS